MKFSISGFIILEPGTNGRCVLGKQVKDCSFKTFIKESIKMKNYISTIFSDTFKLIFIKMDRKTLNITSQEELAGLNDGVISGSLSLINEKCIGSHILKFKTFNLFGCSITKLEVVSMKKYGVSPQLIRIYCINFHKIEDKYIKKYPCLKRNGYYKWGK